MSAVAGTTTDPVYKAVELRGFGPAVLIDTAGFDDEGVLGKMRVERTREAMTKTDVAVILFDSEPEEEAEWAEAFRQRKTPVIAVINKIHDPDRMARVKETVRNRMGLEAMEIDPETGLGIGELKQKIADSAPENFWNVSLTGKLAGGKRPDPAGDAAGYPGAQRKADPAAGADHPGAPGQKMPGHELYGG